MRRTLAKPLSLLLSLSLTCSLMPAPGMAYAVEGENAPIAQEEIDSTSVSSTVDVSSNGVDSTQAPSGSDQTASTETNSTVETTSVTTETQAAAPVESSSATDVTSAISEKTPASVVDTAPTSATDAVATSSQTSDEAKQAEEAAKAKAEEEAKKAEEAAKKAEEEAKKAEEEAKKAEEGKDADDEGDPSLVLSDAELDALMVELDESEIAEVEEGDVTLHAQALQGWVRLAGATALDTMQKVLQYENVFPSKRGGTVIVATADGYWDALSACGLAGIYDAPVVLTHGDALSAQARSEIARLRPTRILVMGGNQAITDTTLNEIKTLCPSIARVAGTFACDTAVEIYKRGAGSWGDKKMAFVCTSDGYWDALTVAPYAWRMKVPIFLTGAGNTLTSSSLEALRQGGFTSVVITGGTNAVSGEVESQLDSIGIKNHVRKGGPTALDTSGLLAQWELENGLTMKHLTVATSNGYWDALAAAPLAGAQDSIIVLVDKRGDYRALDAVYNYKNETVVHGHIIGGTEAIPSNVENRVEAKWALKSVSLSSSAVRPGDKVKISSSITMGDAKASDFKYKYSWARTDGSNSGNSDFITANTYEVQLSQPGDYTLTVECSGPGGSQSLSRDVAVYQLAGLSIDQSGTTYYANANLSVAGNCASGVQFRFTYERHGGGSGELRGWSWDPACSIDPGSIGGWGSDYTITVEARDGAGSIGSASATLRPDRMTAEAMGRTSPTDWLVMVDWTDCWVGIYQGGPGNWNRVRFTRCSVGWGDNTPIGEFYIGDKGYSFGHGYTAYYWTDYWLGAWAFHSILYQEGTFDVQDGRLGQHVSMGCIRLPIEEAKWLQDNVPYDTKVVIYK